MCVRDYMLYHSGMSGFSVLAEGLLKWEFLILNIFGSGSLIGIGVMGCNDLNGVVR